MGVLLITVNYSWITDVIVCLCGFIVIFDQSLSKTNCYNEETNT